MIFITGDCHGRFDKLINFATRMELTTEDIIIVLGDMGLLWRNDKKDFNQFVNYWENEFAYKCRLYWVRGNHENYKLIKKLPVENNMLKCSENIYMLRDGEVYDFGGKRCLIAGGADSIDRFRRTEGLSWWKEEAVDADIVNAAIQLNGNTKLDYVFSHAAPAHIVKDYKVYLCDFDLNEDEVDRTSENLLQLLSENIDFSSWFFGHYHKDICLNENFTCLYNTFLTIE